MQYFDIVLFALIAIFLVLRLHNILGGRGGFDGKGQNDGADGGFSGPSQDPARDNDNVIELPHATGGPNANDQAQPAAEPEVAQEDAFEGPLKEGIAAICAADPAFRVEDFLGGAKYAFEMVLAAYADGNTRALKGLLSPEVYADFQHAIQSREEAAQTLEETLVGIPKAEVMEASMEGRQLH